MISTASILPKPRTAGRRELAGRLFDDGFSVVDIALLFSVTVRTALRWYARREGVASR